MTWTCVTGKQTNFQALILGTDEWLASRSGHFTACDVSMNGSGPSNTPLTL
jgi:hypothetical protein